MKKILARHKDFWNSQHRSSLYLGIFLLALSFMVQVEAGQYSVKKAALSGFTGDVFLDNLPTLDIDFIIVQGAMYFWLFSMILLVSRPRYLLFSLKAIALFVICRAFFISLTHIGIHPGQIVFDDSGLLNYVYSRLISGGEFFFSGHTGAPFLLALIFWDDKYWRMFFLCATVFFGASVLFAHVHYSIDVFAAPFITYGIFRIATKIFRSDYLFMRGRFEEGKSSN
ncbi:MAG: phosphatase PAP2-related protein [Patescibacteria group bacterium]